MKKLYSFQLILLIALINLNQLFAQTAILDLNTEYQEIKGFGGINHPIWYSDLNSQERDLCFGNGDGQIGLTVLRTYVSDNPNQWSQGIQTAQRAVQLGAIVFASPWNPPASMTYTDGTGQKRINTASFGAYAQHLNDYVTYMSNNGVDFYAISTQNEPDYAHDWTEWTPQESVDFIKGYADQINCRLMTPESFQYRKDVYDPILNDADALSKVDIFGTHLYGTQLSQFPYPLFEQNGNGKELWMTEVYTDSQNDANLWGLAMDMAEHMHNAMAIGQFQTYVWWPLRRYYALIHDGEGGHGNANVAAAGTVTKRGWVMAQFSKFIRPGAKRVSINAQPTGNVFLTAYKNTDGKLAIVAVNRNGGAQNIQVTIQGGNIFQFDKYTTSDSKNVSDDGTINVSGSTVTLSLDGNSITTFVGEDATAAGFPTVSITSPTTGASFNSTGNITIQANASDPDGTISNVQFYANGNLIGSDNTAPYAYNWTGVDVGNYVITAAATDNDGNSTTSSGVNVTVLGNIVVRATGTDGTEILELEIDGNVVETWTMGTSYQTFTYNGPSTGLFRLNFTNDATGLDVQVDYLEVDGVVYQAEDQAVNTAYYANGSCGGGSHSELMHCNGYIEFDLQDCDLDSDNDGTNDCLDECPNDPNKIASGSCGCGVAEGDCGNHIIWAYPGGDQGLAACKAKFVGNIMPSSWNGPVIRSDWGNYWNQVSPENAGKWGVAEPNRDQYNWGDLDQMYNYCEANGLPFKQHVFVWGSQQPDWIAGLSQQEQREEVEEWYSLFAQRYPNTAIIDVVNESLPGHAPDVDFRDALGGFNNGASNPYLSQHPEYGPYGTGWDYIIYSFAKAREYFPDAILLLNDYNIINSTSNINGHLEIVNILKDRGLIDAVGIQCHAFSVDNMTGSQITNGLDLLATAGLPIHVTELDIRGDNGNEQQQRDRYATIFPAFYEHPAVACVTIWGYVEGLNWFDYTGLLNSDGSERMAMTWLKSYMEAQPDVCNAGIPPTVSLTAPANGSTYEAPLNITISATASDADGSVTAVEFFVDGNSVGTDNSSPYSISWNATNAGTYVITAVATDNDGLMTTSASRSITVTIPQGPYDGNIHQIPGTIQAEDYDVGGQGVAYNDSDAINEGGATYRSGDGVDIESTTDVGGGYNVGYIINGEWLEYTVNVNTAGDYDIDVRVARDGDNGQLHIEMDGVDITGTIDVPNTGGWQVWQTVTINNVSLTSGQKIMRVVFDSDYMNLNYVAFTPVVVDCNRDPGGSAYLDNCGICVAGNTGNVACTQDCNGDWGGSAYLDNCGTCVEGNTGNTACSQDCNGDWGGTADYDNCGTCVAGNTGNVACTQDCNGDWGGSAYLDNCGTCVEGNTGNTACTQDCHGDWGGSAYLDNCGTCVEGNTGNTACSQDCNGDWGGTAYYDNCGTCVAGNTGNVACTQDCNGEWGGSAYLDNCGTCVEGNTGNTACSQDCNGDWGGTAYYDNCGTCVAGNTGNVACTQDCNGDWGGSAYLDNCGTCVEGNTGNTACSQDCNGDWGGAASIDQCGVCSGGNTGITTNSTCLDCNGDINGTAFIDGCNQCVGGNTGEVACDQDCNGDFGGTASIDQCGVCSGGNTGVTPNESCMDCNGDINGDANIDVCGNCSGGNTGLTPTTDIDECVTSVANAQVTEVTIHPNPTEGRINLNREFDWKLFNVSGQILLIGTGSQIDMMELPAGIYFLYLNQQVIRVEKL